MKQASHFNFISVITLILLITLSACSSFWPGGPGINQPVQSQDGWEITVRDSYQGIKLGNLQDIYLQEGYGFITLEVCIRNLTETEQVVHIGKVFILTEDGATIFPIGQGYKQSEVFGWLVTILKPFGGKRVVDDLLYFPIQSDELARVSPKQSQGCKDSYKLKTYAYLFMFNTERLDKPFTLHFLDSEINLTARKPIVIPRQTMRWLKRLGIASLILLGTLFWLRRKRRKAKEFVQDEEKL